VEFRDVVRHRKMVRSFATTPVAREVVDRMLANAQRAPSAGFTQGFAFLVLEGAEETGRFWSITFADAERREAFGHPRLLDAPVLVVPMSSKQAYLDRYAEPDKGIFDKRESFWPVPYWHIDAAFATMLLLLGAVDEGLGALFFGIFPEHLDGVRRAFGVPDDWTPIGAVALGHPAPDDRPSTSLRRGRKPFDVVVHRGRWGTP
jgi:nitroreductase